jgi:hypothetical protein
MRKVEMKRRMKMTMNMMREGMTKRGHRVSETG